ncbi:hypothetical protein O0I10_009121 [Lichtheimia ornata]|uniref:Uncharacterized protein n=1 Tax=Lichtheimia ornata TaxID=688661 RepID=A0AAD7XW74_9FUNG|nr:uncharacterized protein O0I10_009121 [Lichtheimia ornata]KAJ8655253.1 hypothetical protein O0I10_009121 [Lichtheimia ornata]
MTRIPLQTRHKCSPPTCRIQQHIQLPSLSNAFSPAEPYPSHPFSPTRMDASHSPSFMDAYFDLKSWTTRRYRSICQPSTPLIPSIPTQDMEDLLVVTYGTLCPQCLVSNHPQHHPHLLVPAHYGTP